VEDRHLRLIVASPVERLARTVEALLVVASQPLSLEDLAEAAVFLAADAKATTGTTLFVDGGWTAH